MIYKFFFKIDYLNFKLSEINKQMIFKILFKKNKNVFIKNFQLK